MLERHCERSEAIQAAGHALDCVVATLRAMADAKP
jgi:hypothetical protein